MILAGGTLNCLAIDFWLEVCNNTNALPTGTTHEYSPAATERSCRSAASGIPLA